MNAALDKLKKELHKIIVGQEAMIDGLLIGLLCEGHILVEGAPGLAKTTTINALSKAIGLDSKRIQFTPDLLPSDILGAQIYNPKDHSFSIKKGPLFTHLLLADEINRAPAKVQSALLEVMQERQITIADETFKLDAPFLVMATQNPIENEGVYALPEAQLDRFMMKIVVNHNSEEEELVIMKKVANKESQSIQRVLTMEELFAAQEAVDAIHIDEELEKYIVQIIVATRDPEKFGIDNMAENILFGASPRASIDLYKAAKAQAFLRGNTFVTPADIGFVVHAVLRHRIVLSYEAMAKNMTTDRLISTIIETLPIP
ncbi:MAG TPA: MoxR family ATPase [Sulfurovum sp.]|jgi:MoxR-like ATPase|nr:MAG: ATPase [Sulfurovum sp. 35-42-20]OYY57716.1 MAG: ATPase [Sulfurovum sp. 28-43-6]OYZ24985.1 MAG: ATPase [Sulfurovum sp. 16-42-52]OYZ49623.1 MAG: ATPase [Sulfurovum sp. 24-42-9]OZA44897.1 MAG: ATPase [Sulfurovum sp. 17-42-90]OZA59776.1 MAG: ATPase [Sulfurovum sp. 39-42-12]HQR73740.1 MoxR family ATPase [Sulfurovum sp.]